MKVLVLHGPNLNLLGHRDPEHYGRVTLAEIDARLAEVARAEGAEVDSRQSNHEGALVDWLQGAAFDDAVQRPAGVVMNPGGFGHTSVALRDAVDAVVAAGLPVVEVHLSNVHGREPFRERLLTGAVASGIVSGLGPFSYELGLRAVIALAQRPT